MEVLCEPNYSEDGENCDEYSEEDEPSTITWELQFEGSVYDDSILRIIKLPGDRVSTPIMFALQIFTVVLVILSNFALQVMVITRLHKINEVGASDTIDKVFGPPFGTSGSCWKRDSSMFPDFLPKAGTGPGEFTWDCSPMLPMLLSNVSWLDSNSDGVWSAADDLKGFGNFYEEKFGKSGNLTRTFDRFLQEIKDDKFRHSTQLSEAQKESETKNFTEIPMKWMKAQQPVISLCINVDRRLCANLENRGALKKFIPEGQTPADRVDLCRHMNDRCDNLFGEVYRSYLEYAEETCGAKSSEWDVASRTILHSYEQSSLYNPSEKDSVTRLTYLVFLALVLIIWWLCVLEELRRVGTWCWVLFYMPCNGNSVTTDCRGQTTVEAISNAYKSVVFTFIMLPRTGIIIALSLIGSVFLIGSDDYGELILN